MEEGMRSEQEVTRAIEYYADMVRRLCLIYLKNEADTDDVFQTVFLKYALSSVTFESLEHEKAWMLRVTINECKDILKSFFRRKTVSIEEAMEEAEYPKDEQSDLLEAVIKLPKKYKEVVYLHYYEDYSAVEIAEMIHKNVNTVYTRLARARTILKEQLGGEFD